MNKGKHGLSGSELHEIHDRKYVERPSERTDPNSQSSFHLRSSQRPRNPDFQNKKAATGIVASKEDGIDSAITAIVREIERVHKFGFTASEYARAKANYLRMLESAYNERNKVKNGAYVDEYVRHFIDNEPIPGIENEYAIMNQIVPNLSVEMVNSLIPALYATAIW